MQVEDATSAEGPLFSVEPLDSSPVPQVGQPLRVQEGRMPFVLVVRGLQNGLVPHINGCQLEEFPIDSNDPGFGNASTSTTTDSVAAGEPQPPTVSTTTTTTTATSPTTMNNFPEIPSSTEPNETAVDVPSLFDPRAKFKNSRCFLMRPEKSGLWEFIQTSGFSPETTFACFVPDSDSDIFVVKVIVTFDSDDIRNLPVRVRKLTCKEEDPHGAEVTDLNIEDPAEVEAHFMFAKID